jgi:hypothetical protein
VPPPASSTALVRRSPTELVAEAPQRQHKPQQQQQAKVQEQEQWRTERVPSSEREGAGALVPAGGRARSPPAPPALALLLQDGPLACCRVSRAEEALSVLRPRWLRVAAAVRERALAAVQGRPDLTAALRQRMQLSLPLLMEANALARTVDKPVAFFYDVAARPARPDAAQVAEVLASIKQLEVAEALGLGRAGVLAPQLLALAAQEPQVVVRARCTLTGHEAELTLEALQAKVDAFKAARARVLARMYTEGRGAPAATPALGHGHGHGPSSSSSVGTAEEDPFLPLGPEETTLGASEVGLAPLLEGKNVIGVFPLLSPLDGGCVGAARVRLICNGASPAAREPYTLRMEVENVMIEAAQMAALRVHMRSEKDINRVALRWSFWHAEVSGEIPLSERSATVQRLHERTGPDAEAGHHGFPMRFLRELEVPCVDPSFLSYLAAGALQLALVARQGLPGRVRDAWGRREGGGHHEGPRLYALRSTLNIDPPAEAPPASPRIQALVPLGTPRHDDDLASELGSVLGGADSCSVSRLSLRSARGGGAGSSAGMRPASASASASARTRAGSRRLGSTRSVAGSAARAPVLVFMAVDVWEPELDLSHPETYMGNAHPRYLETDVKRPRWRLRDLGAALGGGKPPAAPGTPRVGGGSSVLGGMSLSQFGVEDAMDAMEPWASEMDASSVAGSEAGTGAAASEPIFHVMGTPLVTMRQLRIVIQQIEPLEACSLESVARVTSSAYVKMLSREYDGDISDQTSCSQPLHVISVVRTASKRRLEVFVELPAGDMVQQCHARGERAVLMVEVEVYMEGAVRPLRLRRNVVMKAVPPSRKSSMLYTLRRSLRDPTPAIDRLHTLGAYYTAKPIAPSHLPSAMEDFVAYKLDARRQLLERTELARACQEAPPAALLSADPSGPSTDVALEILKEVLVVPTPGIALEQEGGQAALAAAAADDAYVASVLEYMQPPAAPVPHARERATAAAALFGVTATPCKRAPTLRVGDDGLFRLQHGEDAGPAFTYAYNPTRRISLEDSYAAVVDVDVRELVDYPAQRAGFLGVRTGLLGASWSRGWFIWRRPFLMYFKSKGQREPSNVVNVSDCRIGRGRDELEIVLRAPKRTWALQAANESDLLDWMHAFDPVNMHANLSTVYSH